ncbi:MAG: beta-galactosidase [Clostridia bacterium]|nr:beta-galactosidase [Clostridia bacterium]
MKDYINPDFKHMVHGGDYNPDQWLDYPEVLSEDMRLMKLSHCNEMTLGIFAWSALEPEEGKFNFEWMDKVMDDIHKAGGKVVLATPSGAKPAWMAQKYVETLRVNDRGERYWYGERHNHCYTSPIYREKVKLINQKLAERYKDHPALIGWHLSNEYGGECYCDLCKEAFRGWLKKKYGSIKNLNGQWWNAFWSHTFNGFDQINPPSPLGENHVHGLKLDWKRFVSEQTADFVKHEYDSVKSITPNIPVTANLMGFYQGLNYRDIVKVIDYVSWDNYPNWVNTDHDINVAQYSAMCHDLMRSLNCRPFYLMESTPSHVNWKPYNKLKRPKVHMLSSLQAVAHGSDSVQYFQWRKSRGSFEKFHGAVVDHVGNEHTRVFKDVTAVGERLEKLDEVVGTVVRPKVALMYDWDNQWAIDMAGGFQLNDKKISQTNCQYYNAFWSKGVDIDIIGADSHDFNDYKVIFAPMRYMVSDALGEKLKSFVKNGGTLVCTYMTGMVNENDLCHLGGWPGAGLREVFGIWNEEIDTLNPGESNTVKLKDGTVVKAVDYCELIHSEGAEVLAEYDSDFYKGMPAYTVNRYGEGKAYYIAFRDDGSFTKQMINDILDEVGVSSEFDGALKKGVTAHSRTDGENTYVFLENYTPDDFETETGILWTEVDTGKTLTGKFTLSGYGTLILKK